MVTLPHDAAQSVHKLKKMMRKSVSKKKAAFLQPNKNLNRHAREQNIQIILKPESVEQVKMALCNPYSIHFKWLWNAIRVAAKKNYLEELFVRLNTQLSEQEEAKLREQFLVNQRLAVLMEEQLFLEKRELDEIQDQKIAEQLKAYEPSELQLVMTHLPTYIATLQKQGIALEIEARRLTNDIVAINHDWVRREETQHAELLSAVKELYNHAPANQEVICMVKVVQPSDAASEGTFEKVLVSQEEAMQRLGNVPRPAPIAKVMDKNDDLREQLLTLWAQKKDPSKQLAAHHHLMNQITQFGAFVDESDAHINSQMVKLVVWNQKLKHIMDNMAHKAAPITETEIRKLLDVTHTLNEVGAKRNENNQEIQLMTKILEHAQKIAQPTLPKPDTK